MNKVKGILVVALVFAMSVPCFAGSVSIKRKKGKWNHLTEQRVVDSIGLEINDLVQA